MEDQELTKDAGLVLGFGIGGCDVGVKWVKIRIDRLTNAAWGHPAYRIAHPWLYVRLGPFPAHFNTRIDQWL